MSADQLKRAAAKLRQIGEQTTPGPWHAEQTISSDLIMDDCGVLVADCGLDEDVVPEIHADAAWIALANPAIAEPLADWLESDAGLIDDMTAVGFSDAILTAWFTPALTVARTILGEPS